MTTDSNEFYWPDEEDEQWEGDEAGYEEREDANDVNQTEYGEDDDETEDETD